MARLTVVLLVLLLNNSLAQTGSALLAVRDSYETFANTSLEVGVPASSPVAVRYSGSVLSNDIGSNTSVTATTDVTGGSLSMQPDGSFSFSPAPGFVGEAGFSYTATLGDRSSEARVTINVRDVNPGIASPNAIWYVRGGTQNGRGTSDAPFASLQEAEAASNEGDIIFIFSGTYACSDTCIRLKANQQLLGQGVDLTLAGSTLLVAGTAPILRDASWTGVQLADAVHIRGLTLTRMGGRTIGSSAIRGNDLLQGEIVLEDLNIEQPGGFGINISETDATDPATGGGFSMTLRRLTISRPGQMGMLLNDAAAILIEDSLITDFDVNDGEAFSGRGIFIESEYDTRVTIRNSQLTSSSRGRTTQGLVGLYVLKNNSFGNAENLSTLEIDISNTTISLPESIISNTVALQFFVLRGGDGFVADRGNLSLSGTGNSATANTIFIMSAGEATLSGTVEIDESLFP